MTLCSIYVGFEHTVVFIVKSFGTTVKPFTLAVLKVRELEPEIILAHFIFVTLLWQVSHIYVILFLHSFDTVG